MLTGQKVDSVTYTIVHELRLPRALVAVLAGAMLALAGAIMQAVTRNPLADPDLTGASSGAVFFAVLWLSRQLFYRNVAPPDISIPAVAMVGSVLTGGFVYVLSRGRDRQSNTMRMILTAVMVSAIFRSLTSLILLVNQNATTGILTWLIGSLNGVTWEHWDTIWPWAAFTIPVGLACAGVANVLHLGDDIASGLGSRVERARLLLLFVAVLLTAAAVSVVGALGFSGSDFSPYRAPAGWERCQARLPLERHHRSDHTHGGRYHCQGTGQHGATPGRRGAGRGGYAFLDLPVAQGYEEGMK